LRRSRTLIGSTVLSLAVHATLWAGLAHFSVTPAWRLGEPVSRGAEVTVTVEPPARAAFTQGVANAGSTNKAGAITNAPRATAAIDAPGDMAQMGGPSTAAAVLGEVRSRLARYLAYPPLARARGWEGTVLVGFHLGADGALDAIRVARSSGYDILDASALDSLGKVGRLDDVAGITGTKPQQLELAVMYRLERR